MREKRHVGGNRGIPRVREGIIEVTVDAAAEGDADALEEASDSCLREFLGQTVPERRHGAARGLAEKMVASLFATYLRSSGEYAFAVATGENDQLLFSSPIGGTGTFDSIASRPADRIVPLTA